MFACTLGRWGMGLCMAGVGAFAAAPSATAQTANAEATLVKILAADETPFDPNTFEPDGDGIVDRAHFRLLDRILDDPTVPRHIEILARWNANRAQVDEDNQLSTLTCRLLENALGLTCTDFELYGASQITIGDPVGNARIQRLLDTVGIDVDLSAYDVSAATWLAAAGDLDGDGFSNLAEYNAVCANFDAFVAAAIDPAITPETLFCCGNCPLEFIALPVGADKYVGESHTFAVVVDNEEADPQYQWRRDGQPVGGNTPALTLDNLALGQAGEYTCEVSDGGETITTPPATLRVANRMAITTQPLSVQAYVGEQVNFGVAVSGGLLPLDYTWTRNGSPVGVDSPALVIPAATLASAGEYRCEIGDLFETVLSDAALLEVANRISIATQPQPQTVVSGRSVTFSIVAQGGIGALSYQWLHDGATVGGNAPSLHLQTVTPQQAGRYWCVVSDNRESRESNRVPLSIVDSLAIATQPQGARKLVGQNHVLQVVAVGGLPPVTFAWFKGASPVSGATGASLSLQALGLDNAGSYTCVVTDAERTITSNPALVEVFDPLRFTRQPQGASKLTGAAHVFEVETTGGGGDETYRWLKDGQPLDATGPQLEMPSLVRSDSGAYQCRVTDEFGSITSNVANLTVGDTILLSTQPEGAAKYTGESHVLNVVATGGLAKLSYQWFKDDVATGNTGDTLALDALSPADSGRYYCEVTDGNEVVLSATALVEVADHLQLLTEPLGARLLAGETLELRVETSGGLGNVHFQWHRDATPLDVDAPIFTLDAVALADAGDYRCVVSDRFESINSSVVPVVVANPLQVLSAPTDATLKVGEDATLQVAVSGGLGEVAFTWYRDDILLEATGATLTLTNLQRADSGAYRCEISDERTVLETTPAMLTVITPIRWTEQLVERALLAGENVALTVAATGGDAPLTYAWFVDGRLSSVTGTAFPLNPVRPEDAGLYVCRVTDGYQQLVSEAVRVSVLPRLRISAQPVGGSVVEGAPFQSGVAATDGVGEYNYAWRKGDALLDVNGPVLRIEATTIEDRGEYACDISDDFDTLRTLPATLVVTPAPKGVLATNPAAGSTLAFGLADIGDVIQRDVTLSNTGDATLAVQAALSGDAAFQLAAGKQSLNIEPGASETLRLSFTPDKLGLHHATLTLTPGGGAPVEILLLGEGKAPKGFFSCGSAPSSTPSGAGADVLVIVLAVGLMLAGNIRQRNAQ